MIRGLSSVLIWAFLALVTVVVPATAGGHDHAGRHGIAAQVAVSPPIGAPESMPSAETRGHPASPATEAGIANSDVHPCGDTGCPGHGGRDHGKAGCDCPAACAALLLPDEVPGIARFSASSEIVIPNEALRAVAHIPPVPPPRA